MKKFVREICYFIIFILIFQGLNLLLIQKDMFNVKVFSKNFFNPNEFYDLEKDSLDVLFIGCSQVGASINPLQLYNEYGFTSYILNGPSSSLEKSYYFLKEAIKTQSPKVVVYEVASLFYEDYIEKELEMVVLTRMNNSYDKYLVSQEVFDGDENIEYKTFSTFVPLVQFHERWKNITSNDFTAYSELENTYLKGYLSAYRTDKEHVNDFMENVEKQVITDNYIYYLDNMKNLCEENGIEFVLMKAPTSKIWNYGWYEATNEYAMNNDLKYLDFNTFYNDIGIDDETCFHDYGHLNPIGSKIMTTYYGKYLIENFQLPDKRNNEEYSSWEKDYERFALEDQRYQLGMELIKITDLEEYEIFLEQENYEVCIVDKKSEITQYEIDNKEFVIGLKDHKPTIMIGEEVFEFKRSQTGYVIYDKVLKQVVDQVVIDIDDKTKIIHIDTGYFYQDKSASKS